MYEQIIDHIKKMIVRGELQPGDKLPSQRELA
ncbi:MAG: GntR family transcriptional regulator, partial [Alcaligenaceae bacterium]|nr:GntR family transcriptional regulator [Alcaligenaceae bacterium]